MESLINKFTRKYICFYNLLGIRGLETGKLRMRGVAEKRLRTGGLKLLRAFEY